MRSDYTDPGAPKLKLDCGPQHRAVQERGADLHLDCSHALRAKIRLSSRAGGGEYQRQQSNSEREASHRAVRGEWSSKDDRQSRAANGFGPPHPNEDYSLRAVAPRTVREQNYGQPSHGEVLVFDTADPTATLALLKKMSDASEAYVAHTFELVRKSRAGATQFVTVTVLDAGPSEQNRFHISAQTRDGGKASGNPAKTIESALAQVHWGYLDRPNP